MTRHLTQRLTVKHLRLIAAIAEHRQLSLAAQALALTQPAASRSLSEVEQLCGAAVFERHPRGMTLTPMGELLARRARNVLEELADAGREVAAYKSGSGGLVRIGAVTGAAIGYVVPVVQHLRATTPEAEIHVEVGMSRELVRDLLALRLDFVLARIPPEVDARQFEVVRASGEEVDVIVGAGHPCAHRAAVRLAELLAFDWVMQSSGAPIRVAVEEALLCQETQLPSRITNTSSLLVTIAMLTSSHAVAPVSREVAELLSGLSSKPSIVPVQLQDRIVVSSYSLLALRNRRLSPIAERCRTILSEALCR